MRNFGIPFSSSRELTGSGQLGEPSGSSLSSSDRRETIMVCFVVIFAICVGSVFGILFFFASLFIQQPSIP